MHWRDTTQQVDEDLTLQNSWFYWRSRNFWYNLLHSELRAVLKEEALGAQHLSEAGEWLLFPFSDAEIEAQRSLVICSRSHSWGKLSGRAGAPVRICPS
jgi:hypothetical protein